MELGTYYLEEFKEIRITEPSKEHHEERAIPPPWKRIWVSKKGGGGGTTVLAISYADHTLEGRAKNKEQMLLLQLKRNVWICKSDGIEKF